MKNIHFKSSQDIVSILHTRLCSAIENRRVAVISQILNDYGSLQLLSQKDKDGRTPIELAEKHNRQSNGNPTCQEILNLLKRSRDRLIASVQSPKPSVEIAPPAGSIFLAPTPTLSHEKMLAAQAEGRAQARARALALLAERLRTAKPAEAAHADELVQAYQHAVQAAQETKTAQAQATKAVLVLQAAKARATEAVLALQTAQAESRAQARARAQALLAERLQTVKAVPDLDKAKTQPLEAPQPPTAVTPSNQVDNRFAHMQMLLSETKVLHVRLKKEISQIMEESQKNISSAVAMQTDAAHSNMLKTHILLNINTQIEAAKQRYIADVETLVSQSAELPQVRKPKTITPQTFENYALYLFAEKHERISATELHEFIKARSTFQNDLNWLLPRIEKVPANVTKPEKIPRIIVAELHQELIENRVLMSHKTVSQIQNIQAKYQEALKKILKAPQEKVRQTTQSKSVTQTRAKPTASHLDPRPMMSQALGKGDKQPTQQLNPRVAAPLRNVQAVSQEVRDKTLRAPQEKVRQTTQSKSVTQTRAKPRSLHLGPRPMTSQALGKGDKQPIQQVTPRVAAPLPNSSGVRPVVVVNQNGTSKTNKPQLVSLSLLKTANQKQAQTKQSINDYLSFGPPSTNVFRNPEVPLQNNVLTKTQPAELLMHFSNTSRTQSEVVNSTGAQTDGVRHPAKYPGQ